MTTKLFELRDKGTFVPAFAIKVEPTSEQEHYLIRRSGYGEPLILMGGPLFLEGARIGLQKGNQVK